jgi:hypothetical protein
VTPTRSQNPRRSWPAQALRALGVLAWALAAGCISSPVNRQGQRSQYDRHEALRGNLAEPYVEDEFGRMIPNLRPRLLSRD